MAEVTFVQEPTGPNAPEQTPAADPNRPEWLDPKFETPEAQAQAYAELQAKFTQQSQELATLRPKDPQAQAAEAAKEQQPDPNAAKPDDPEAAKDKAAEEIGKAANVDFAPYTQEFVDTGDVSVESQAKIVEALTKAIPGVDWAPEVRDFVEGKKHIQKNNADLIANATGGEENYVAMAQWAQKNWTPQQIAAFDAQVEGGNIHASLIAIQGLRAQYERATGVAPARTLTGNTGGPADGGGKFKSVAEMSAAMKDPRYKTDPAYRAQVAARI